MRFLTEKQIDAMSWKERHLYFLETFEEDAKRWKSESDDRRLFSNIYNHLVEAINSLPENPHIAVCVAMNDYIENEEQILKKIRTHFEGR